LRLLECPTVLGYLDPILRIRPADGTAPLVLPAPANRTAADVKASLGEVMNVSESDLTLFEGTSECTDDMWMKPCMDLRVFELASVCLRVVTGCCGDSFPDARIKMDGEHKGCTDRRGNFNFKAIVGEHSLSIDRGSDESSVCQGIDSYKLVVGCQNAAGEFDPVIGNLINCSDPRKLFKQ
jgi:hypothetical protein